MIYKYADIKECDIANGPGVRTSLFVSGCYLHCPGCFNSAIWDFNAGDVYTNEVEDKVIDLVNRPYITGLSILGGEPLIPERQEMILGLVKRVRKECPGKTIWCYSGFRFEEEIMGQMYDNLEYTKQILETIDVLVDGRWMQELYDPMLRYRGSSNQRLIDMKKTVANNMKVVLWDKGYGK